ncbi:hypothetical protein ACFX2J_000410 [Malus domestica]
MDEKLMACFKQVVVEHILSTTNRYADDLATLNSKLIFVNEQPNIAVIRRERPTINALFSEEAPKGDNWRETVRRELSKPSRELSIKCLKEYINVTGHSTSICSEEC